MSETLSVNRRQFLTMSGLVAGALMVNPAGPRLSSAEAAGMQRWSDRLTWGGAVPGKGARVVVDKAILLDVDVELASLTITPSGALHFDAATSRTLASRGNVVVEGLLQMRPSSAAVVHTLRFIEVNEAAFVGGGMEVLDSDVGLWCKGAGVLDLAGTPRLAWARTSETVAAGATSLTLQADPVGWQVGDELVITPTGRPGVRDHSLAYDTVTIAAVEGRKIRLTGRTVHEHPAVEVGPGMHLAPEVLNLTRNVRVEGTEAGRAHIWLHPSSRQSMSYFAMRYLGPRQADGKYTKSVVGRYGLHIHMAGDAARESQIVGAVARDLGGHAYVAHESHGVTFTSCISHQTMGSPYWWDGRDDRDQAASETQDAVYDHCVASLVTDDPPSRGYRLSGFELKSGSSNQAHHCVAVGVQGNKGASGFIWPESSKEGVWGFQSCVAHNNRVHGIFTWQNTPNLHVVENFIAYHNGGAGVSHGAYRNSYHYRNAYLFGNRVAGVSLHAHSRGTDGGLRFTGLHVDGAGLSPHGFALEKHTLEPSGTSRISACTFVGHLGSAVGAVYGGTNGETTPEALDLVDCESDSPLLWLLDGTDADSRVRVQDAEGAVLARPKGQPGAYRPDWNAAVAPIDSFDAGGDTRATTFPLAGGAPLPAIEQRPMPEVERDAAVHDPGHPTTTEPPEDPPAEKTPNLQRHGGVEARLIHGKTFYALYLVNETDHACTVEVSFDGARTATYRAEPGRVKVRLPHVSRSGFLTASCHSARFRWYVHPIT